MKARKASRRESPCATALAVAAALAAFTAFGESAGGRLSYDYTVSRRDVEKGHGALNDGKDSTQIVWHTRFKETTDVVCELPQTCDLDLVELHETRHNRYYITKEIRVSLDDGSGDFGDPVVLPPLPDVLHTNHVWKVEKPGRAVRVKISMTTDAYGALTEVALYGRPAAGTDAHPAKAPAPGRTVENGRYRLTVSPSGGRASSIWSKTFGFEMTEPNVGAFTESCWDRRQSIGFLADKPFAMQSDARDGGFTVSAVGNAQGGGINFLRVEKRYASSEDSTALSVVTRFVNIPEAMAKQSYAPLFASTLGVRGGKVNGFYPTDGGIVTLRHGETTSERWFHRPSRGWMAVATDEGQGVAMTMPAADVRDFRCVRADVPRFEWRMVPVELDCDEGHGVAVELIPFKGLRSVSGAGGGFVGELKDGTCRVVCSRAGRVVAEADGEERSLSFVQPGATVEFKTAAKTVRLMRNGLEVCRLDAAPSEGAWRLPPLVASRAKKVREVDLNCYTNFPSSGAVPWAKPLPGKRLRVGVVTGLGNQLEVGRLAERFDMEYRTAPVSVSCAASTGKYTMNNPVFSFGDHFSQIDVKDSFRAVRKAIDWECDALLVAGIPFEAFPEDLRKLLVEKVRSGVGLVWIGGDRDVPELGLKRSRKPLKRQVAQAVGEAFADVPFELLGEEQVWAFDEEGSVVHAACKDRPYLFERPLGKGRVFSLPYRAIAEVGGGTWVSGLTPDLKDFYPDRIAPAEHYYSLVAKALLAAGGKRLPVRLGRATVTASTAEVAATSDVAGKVALVWSVKNAFGETLAKGAAKHELAKGESVIRIADLAVPAFAGSLELDLAIRTRKGVLAWGAWAFANAPKAAITDVKLDAPYHREGEEVKVEVKGEKGTGNRLRMRVVDSYGRELVRAFPSVLTWSYKVENALPARCCDVIAELVDEKGAVVARRRAELRVRPSREKLAWDDYEAGTWWNAESRDYLWPQMAAAFRDVGISTVIANPHRAQIDFAMRHGFSPTYLSGAGLHRTPEPKEYAATGDKMKLARPTCLSSAKFFAGRDRGLAWETENLPRYGLRFVWFGDEQSLTGYGGDPVDFCFSPDCLREFRSFARGRYGTLERLNAEYESDFRSWDDVLPYTRQEVWAADGKHVAGWADHLEFMDSRLTNALAYCCRKLHAADPDLRFALSGTQMPSAYGGMDWSKILGVLDCALSYGVGGQHEIHRSLAPDGRFMPWDWGYSRRGEEGVACIWNSVFWGCRGIMSFWARSMWRPDLTFSQGLADTAPHVRRLTHGVGKHILDNLALRPDVAVLYSQASFRAAFIEKRREENDRLQEKVRCLLAHLGVAYDYVSAAELAAGVLSRRGYRMLVLADAVALSDEEVAAIRAFAGKGGVVFAEGVPARRWANCRERPAPALADLFRDSRHALVEKVDVAYLKAVEYPDKPENAATISEERRRMEKSLAAAGADGGRLGMTGAETGRTVANASVFVRTDRAGNPFWGVLAQGGKRQDVAFSFPRKAWTYDLVSGRAYGCVNRLVLPLSRGIPYAFVQLGAERQSLADVKTEGARVTVRCTTKADTVVRLRVLRPDGTEATCYAKNLLAKSGEAAWTIPFAPSDPPGTWQVEATEVISGSRRTVPCPPPGRG